MERKVELVERSLAPETYAEFDDRVAEQADQLRSALTDGSLDNEAFSVGLEIEVYAIGEDTGRAADDRHASDGGQHASNDGLRATDDGHLVALPETVFDSAINKELGLHNAELNTEPTPFTADGLAEQSAAIADRLAEARRLAGDGREIVLDAMWGLPPAEGTVSYFSEIDEYDDVFVARNMRPNARYFALDNETVRLADGDLDFSVTGAEHTFPSMLFESLATSIQPHVQIPDIDAFPDYFDAAIRTMGPVLALTTNSPFLPADLYNAVDDPNRVVAETAHELRIAAFEQSMNQTKGRKVRVPKDVEDIDAVVDRVVEDATYAPFLEEWVREETPADFADRFFEFGHKRGTYWRWVRPVLGGTAVEGTCDQRSLRIEYRPLPTQPTVRDNVSTLAYTAGLLRGIVAIDHPLADLDWTAARDSFYSAVDAGLDADLAWVTADGERTTDHDVIFPETFALAREGLAAQGIDQDQRDRLLAPIEARWAEGTTPSGWKKRRVRERLDDGQALDAAIAGMQQEYVRLSREADTFVDWL
jgi:hypothetical protein